MPTLDDDEVERLRVARAHVLGTIAEAADRAGRDPGGVTLVAVSKTVAAERLVAAVAAGLTILGENRVQEAAEKVKAVEGATWHLVGPLQSNKVRRALETFHVIQSVDSVDLARRIDRLSAEVRPGARVPMLLQVNVDRDPTKAGFAPDTIAADLPALLDLPQVELRGLMTIGRLVERPEDARTTFAALRTLSERLQGSNPAFGADLSMGMTDDYSVAVEEGATIVRVGRALFGDRL